LSDEAQDDADLQIVVPMVMTGIIDKERIEQCFRDQTAFKNAGRPMSLLAVMIKNGVLTWTQAMVLKGVSLGDWKGGLAFPDYKVLRHVGEGGMADVYEATYLPVKARVALKILKTEFCLQEGYRLRFKREANILLNLDHDNIVEGREYRTHDGVDFYAMSFVDGISVLDLLDKGVKLTEGLAVHVAAQVADALEHMRQKGIVHRDVKPGNLVVDPEGVVRIIDFGLAKVMKDMRQDVGAETTVGTVEYMSPEQARGESDVDTRSDVYALGVTLFHMATGELPVQGSQSEIMYGHVKQPVEFTPRQRARLSAPTMFILKKALEKDPAARYQTPKEMRDDLITLCAPQLAAKGPVPSLVHETAIEAAPILPKPVQRPPYQRPSVRRPTSGAHRPINRLRRPPR
jgi:serine/threonine protein kinase